MKRILGQTGWLLAVLAVWAPAGARADEGLLRDAEKSRGDLGGVGRLWIVRASTEEEGETRKMKLRVITQGSKVFAEVLEPEKMEGTKYIVADGKMWYHKPMLSRPVSVSRRQRVIGRAAVGDIAAMSFLKNYSIEATEEGTQGGEGCVVFTLKQTSRKANYPMVKYWVSKDRRVGIKAEFYTVSGSKLRTALMKYDHFLSVDGEKRRFLSEMKVVEEIGGAKVTTLKYGEYAVRDFPEGTFDYTKMAPEKRTTGPGKKF